jgi:hypothetical protein
MEFYLEALDRDVKKSYENPSAGLILCSKKDEAVVEYALSRSMSPALVADCKLHLPDTETWKTSFVKWLGLPKSNEVSED